MRLCLLTTGGTIAMTRAADGGLAPPAEPTNVLRPAPELAEQADVVPLMSRDSTDVDHRDWAAVAAAVHARLDAGYDGIVVLHGTDTLAATASALALALGDRLPVPVVLTGAQRPPDDPDGDAAANLRAAARVAVADVGEVVVAFGGLVLRGSRADKVHDTDVRAFASPAVAPLHLDGDARPRAAGVPPLRADFADGVLHLVAGPGSDAALALPAVEACRGLVVQALGAGNLPRTWEPVLARCAHRDVPVVLTSPFAGRPTAGSPYASGRWAVAAGAIPSGDMTTPCAVAKLRWALARAEGDVVASVRRTMATPVAGEVSSA